MLASGDRLGRYEIGAPLGAGGMGEVYRARDTELQRDVALKVVPDSFSADPERLSRFKREARAVARLSHPNVLQIHDVGSDGGRHYVVTELLEGESLRQLLDRGPLPWRRAVDIAREIAAGLAAAHEREVVHRDLKPGNVFITGDGPVKILDFGLARFDSPSPGTVGEEESTVEQTAVGLVLGTPGYMSPEQIRGQPVDRRTDIFSFGCVLYEMLAGRRAFSGSTAADTMSAILTKQPEEISRSGAEVPAALEHVIERSLAKDREARIPSAAELTDALDSIVSEVPTRGRAPLTAPPPGRRRRTAGWVAGALLLVVAVGTGLWLADFLPSGLREPSGLQPEDRSVAVLPFDNLTGNPEYDVWEQGLAELVTTALSNSEDLRVIDAGMVRQLFSRTGGDRDSEPDAAAVLAAAGLDVRMVCSGSLLPAGSGVRVQVKLQEMATGRLLTSHVVDSDSEDRFFAVVDEIAGRVRDHLEIDALRLRNPDYAWSASGTTSAAAYRSFLEGAAYRRRAEFGPAISAFQDALRIDPDFDVARIYLAKALQNDHQRDEAHRIVEDLFARVKSLPPRERSMVLSMKAYLDREPFVRLAHYEKILEIDPLDWEYWYLTGNTYRDVELYEKACEAYERFLELEARAGRPFLKHQAPYLSPAGAYVEQGNLDRALEILELGLSTLPDDPWLLLYAYAASLRAGDVDRADAYMERFRSEFDARVCGELCFADSVAQVLVHFEVDLDRAERELRHALSIDPDYFPAVLRLAGLLVDAGIDVDEGLRLARHASELQPEAHRPLTVRGRAQFELGHYEEAVALLEEARTRQRSYDHETDVYLEKARAQLGSGTRAAG